MSNVVPTGVIRAHRVGVVCDRGAGPACGGREENEDNFLVCADGRARWLDGEVERVEETGGDGLLLAVCDGMGGHDNGRLASTTAVRVLAKLHRPGTPRDPARALATYVLEAHAQLHGKARRVGPVTMGTTLTACWILGRRLAWVHVGDSRLYVLRGGVLTRRTTDHTRNAFLRRDGRPVADDGDHLCQTFIFGSRGLGDNGAIRLDRGRDVDAEELEPGDVLLLCSDGLTSVVDDDGIAAILRHRDPQDAAEALLAEALARGSTDNVTAIVVRVDGHGPTLDPELWDQETEETLRL